ncbi:PII uridylyl-transferase [Cardiobacterium hominis]|uniref:Bifunctional uridylyltransferase/uridylyl-removing enzyme n=1 Tax=Cardiobacterium hominis (strain ATCC 15826 / DSM 8339 / NCTC 10426 / 6573) TaxID=638300 RepID=C8NAS6_CARH6|nr:[protein-PII] uridylyltransferase [Cardiobacterium hominis]EEV88297.1 protein-P-II uridylyltransferase [Cardiobacterium hominis ATCC 15826]VEG78067.1 PII uridylyl-transferase [Cardiobacterium hominis]
MLALPPDWQPAAPALSPLAEAARARDYLRELRHGLAAHIRGRDYDVHRLIVHYTAQIDRILGYLYQRTIANPRIRLYAIGGYGRGELFPASDIDLLLLTPDNLTNRDTIETFIQTLWQLGLDIAQHVHADRDLAPAATADIDLLTSLLENRQLAGEPHPIDPARPPLIAKTAYIRHKQQEQRARDAKQERLGQLEPNLKNSSGGLRDEHMITWLSAYCYHDRSHASLIAKNLMTPGESAGLHESRDALWRIRFALHLGGARQKNTLDFEQQKRLAATFGYRDQRHNLAIEQLMQHYYQHSMRIRRINQRVVSHIEADHQPPQPAVPLTRDYASQHGKLTLRDPASFTQNPNQPWELFQYLQQNPTIREPHPDLVRHIRRHRDSLTNIARRRDADNRRAFLALLAQPGNVHPQLARIHQYGLLYRYIPAFAHITGRMQYDLFHQYTVDQHTLKLIETLDRLVRPDPAYPEAAETLTRLKNPAILYLAALFHDIGKGYDGDHSQTGAQIADLYARENDAIPPEDRALLTWLVAHHLDHSLTAQKKDLTDPDTIAAYAATIPSAEHLDHLYLLTLADISATNPSLWNTWRASLLYDLYQQTRHQLEHHQDSLHAREHRAREQAKAQLASDAQTLEHLWAQLPEAYFRGETAAAIAAKTRHLLARADNTESPPLQSGEGLGRGCENREATTSETCQQTAPSPVGEGWGGGSKPSAPATTSEARADNTAPPPLRSGEGLGRVCENRETTTSETCQQTAPSPVGEGWGGGSKPSAPATSSEANEPLPPQPGKQHAVSLIQEHPPRLFITSPNPPDILLVRITHYLEQHNHNIHEARLYTTADHRLTLQEYTLSENPPPAPELAHELEQHIADKQPPPPLARRLPRERLKHFTTHTRVHIQPEGDHTTLELTCKDRHGLLSLISRILLAHGVHISHAKIGTYGEKVEDSFHLTDARHRPLTDAATLAALKQALLEALQ